MSERCTWSDGTKCDCGDDTRCASLAIITHHELDEGSDGEHAWCARKPDATEGKPFLDKMRDKEHEYYLKHGMPGRQRDYN